MASTVRATLDVSVPMRDGVHLSTDIWLPDGEGPWPVLLQRTPYDKSSTFQSQHIPNLELPAALGAGFAVVIQDVRGRFGSDGEFVPFVNEAADGADTLAWIEQQDFCNGSIGMFGASYVGATQWLASVSHPPALKAMALQLTSPRYDETWTYRGGALELGFLLLWIWEALAAEDLEHRDLDAKDVSRAHTVLADVMVDPQQAMQHLPVDNADVRLLAPYAAAWWRGCGDEHFWGSVDTREATRRGQLAGLHVGGWNDIFVEGTLEGFEASRRPSESASAQQDQFLVIGPWSHGNMSDWQGDGWLGYAASAQGIDLQTMQLAFFEAALSGTVPDLPRVTYFRSGSDTWHTAEDWPHPAQQTKELFLTVFGALATELPDNLMGVTYTADPLEPVPTTGGANFLPGLLVARQSGPKDQQLVEQRDDVVLFTSEPLTDDLEVTGTVEAVIWAETSGTDCDWAVRLCDVDESGASTGIVDGILRASSRVPGQRTPLVPMRANEFHVTVGSTSHLFRKGHRIRIQVASSNFPRFDRNPQTFMNIAAAKEADMVTAEHTILCGGQAPSRLILPVIA